MSTALEVRYDSAAVRRDATRLRASIDRVLQQAAAVTDKRRRTLYERASRVILAAGRTREAAAKIAPTAENVMLIRATEQECASLMNSAHDQIMALDEERCFAALRGDPIGLARLIQSWLTFTAENVRPKTWESKDITIVKVKGAGDRPLVRVAASSNAEDLESDVFELSALREMRDGFKGRLAFMNHRYSVPADVFGTITGTALHKRQGLTFLDLDIAVEANNPVAMQTYSMIANGTRLGVSVGVLIVEAERRQTGGLSIKHVTPLEASIVGIPANQTAWTQGA